MTYDDSRKKELCPIARVAGILGDECTLLIVRDLMEGPRRYGELERSLRPISSRTIVNKLKLLEKEGIVRRKEYKEKPPRVEYSLTREGGSMRHIIDDMRRVGRNLPRG